MDNLITSIQIRESVKKSLERLKERANESYEDVIIKILRDKDKNKRAQEELLIEVCREMAEESLRITKEFEAIEDLDSWKW